MRNFDVNQDCSMWIIGDGAFGSLTYLDYLGGVNSGGVNIHDFNKDGYMDFLLVEAFEVMDIFTNINGKEVYRYRFVYNIDLFIIMYLSF